MFKGASPGQPGLVSQITILTIFSFQGLPFSHGFDKNDQITCAVIGLRRSLSPASPVACIPNQSGTHRSCQENLTEDMDQGFVLLWPQYFTVFPKNLEGTLETVSVTQLR